MTSASRGACPGLSAPIATGDGLLARFTPRGGIAPRALIPFCAAARRHGNGIVEITARGSLQVRGLTPSSAVAFERDIAALDIAAMEGVPITVDPLPDDPDALIDSAELAAGLQRSIADVPLVLAPKVSVTIDGGGRLHLDALEADVRLRAVTGDRAPRLYFAVGGTADSATPIGCIAPDMAVRAIVNALGVIAAGGPGARARQIVERHGIAAFHSVLKRELEPGSCPLSRPAAEPVAQHPLRDGSFALGIALPFGQANADALAELVQAGAHLGLRLARPAPDRALLLIGLGPAAIPALSKAAEQLGFIVRADDARRRIIACPGKPGCSSGLIAARALARDLARYVPPRGKAIHISGCSKGCAYPRAADLTVVGTDRGCGIIENGSAAAMPGYYVDCVDVIREVGHIIDNAEARHA